MDNDKQGFRRRMRVFLNSVEAANEIFTVYLCTSSDAQSSKRRRLKRTGQIIMMRLRLKKESSRNEERTDGREFGNAKRSRDQRFCAWIFCPAVLQQQTRMGRSLSGTS
jgi:hypothetical protein